MFPTIDILHELCYTIFSKFHTSNVIGKGTYSMNRIISDNIIKFMFGGNATFTIANGVNSYAYKIRKRDTDDGTKIYWCLLLHAGKNIYCGYFKITGNKLTFKYNGKNGVSYNDDRLQTLLTAIHKRANMPEEITVYHAGRCACCGRQLTDATSNERGFGPDCWKKVRIHIGG